DALNSVRGDYIGNLRGLDVAAPERWWAMANSAGGNVVALDEHLRARARIPREQAADALGACRKLALDRMGEALAHMLDRIEDELFELAEGARDRDQQN